MNLKFILLVSAFAAAGAANAVTLTGWTFESLTGTPAASGIASDLGSVAGSASVNTGGTLNAPAGNGSSHSYSANGWNTGEYFQFTTSTLGFKNASISFDQTGSGTGPKSFKLAYSTDGTNFTDALSYTVLLNGNLSTTPNNFWNSTTAYSVYTTTYNFGTALNNVSSVTLRLIDTSTTALNGNTVATGGTSRVDNVIVSADRQAVPEPASMVALGLGAVAMIRRRRKA